MKVNYDPDTDSLDIDNPCPWPHEPDTPEDKTSPVTMEHVGVTVATSAWFLASADKADAQAMLELLEDAATRRLALERKQGAGLVAAAADPKAVGQVERQVMAAWLKWYDEAFVSLLTLPAGEASAELRDAVAAARARLKYWPPV